MTIKHPSFADVPLSACFGYIGDSFDKLSEQQLPSTGDVVLSLLHAMSDVEPAQAMRMLVCIRPWCANLNAYWHSDTAFARRRVYQILQLLLELPLRDSVVSLVGSSGTTGVPA